MYTLLYVYTTALYYITASIINEYSIIQTYHILQLLYMYRCDTYICVFKKHKFQSAKENFIIFTIEYEYAEYNQLFKVNKLTKKLLYVVRIGAVNKTNY